MTFYSNDSQNWNAINNLRLAPTTSNWVKFDEETELFWYPHLQNLIQICSRFISSLVITSPRFFGVYDPTLNQCSIVKSIVFASSGQNFLNRFDNYQTKNVVLLTPVAQHVLDSISSSRSISNIFVSSRLSDQNLNQLPKNKLIMLESGYDLVEESGELVVVGATEPGNNWNRMAAEIGISSVIVGGMKKPFYEVQRGKNMVASRQ